MKIIYLFQKSRRRPWTSIGQPLVCSKVCSIKYFILQAGSWPLHFILFEMEYVYYLYRKKQRKLSNLGQKFSLMALSLVCSLMLGTYLADGYIFNVTLRLKCLKSATLRVFYVLIKSLKNSFQFQVKISSCKVQTHANFLRNYMAQPVLVDLCQLRQTPLINYGAVEKPLTTQEIVGL